MGRRKRGKRVVGQREESICHNHRLDLNQLKAARENPRIGVAEKFKNYGVFLAEYRIAMETNLKSVDL